MTVRAIAAGALLVLAACARTHPSPPRSNPASPNDGARVYIQHCSSCHQLDGRGIPGAFPALAGDAMVTGDSRRVIAIVAHGTPTMPGWKGQISDDDIAAVITYVRATWGNHAPPLSAADVEAQK